MSWDACANEPSTIIRWFECHPGAGGWLAGIAGFAAVVAALAIAVYSEISRRREKQSDRASKAVAVAFRLQLAAKTISGQTEQALAEITIHEWGMVAASQLREGVGREIYALFPIDARFPDDLLSSLDCLEAEDILCAIELRTVLAGYTSYAKSWRVADLRALDGIGRAKHEQQISAMVNGLANISALLDERLGRYVPERQ